MEHLQAIIDELSTFINKQETRIDTISNGSVGWHIYHSLMVINGVSKTLTTSNPNEYKPKISFAKFVVFNLKKIPKGKAKAPKYVTPPENFSTSDLETETNKAIENLNTIKALSANNYFNHPLFGHLNKKDALKFLSIHTNHHIKIIKAIIAA